MRVIEKNQFRLSLLGFDASPWRVVGGMFLIGGIGILVNFPSKKLSSLVCSKSKGTCQIANQRNDDTSVIGSHIHRGPQTISLPINEIESAKIRTQISEDNKGNKYKNYNIVLVTKNYGDIFFINTINKEILIKFTSSINNFVNSPAQPTLKLTHEIDFSVVKGILVTVTLLISIVLLLTEEVVYIFDKESQTFSRRHSGLRGSRTSQPSIKILRVEVGKKVRYSAQGDESIYYNIKLIMVTYEEITLMYSDIKNKNKCNEVAKDIQEILNYK